MTIRCISFHSCRSIRKQIWPCHKNGQGQPSVIVWTNLVVLESPMLYTKFQGHQPLGSYGDFWRFLPYMGLEATFVLDREHFNKFSSTKWRLHILGSAQQGCNYHFLQKSLFCIFWCILYLYISCKKLHLGVLKLTTKNQYLSYGCKWNHGYAQRKSVVSWVTTLLR